MIWLWLFWGMVTVIVYVYAIYPALILIRGKMFRRPYKLDDITPLISLIVAAHNEEANIGARIENALALDYPRDRLEIVIASDGSTDETETIVRAYEGQGVKLLPFPRQGKIPVLNKAVQSASGEILVFSDANSIYVPDALRALIRPFADPNVGGVAGDQRYLKEQDSNRISDGERSYWNIDRQLKQWQSDAGNTISATGAIYAIRSHLYRPIPMGVTDDFVASTAVIAQGYRLLFVPEAIAYEPVAGASGIEFGRKVRVITQGFRSVQVMRELLNPFRYGFYAVQIFSHKVLRRLMFLPLLILFVASAFLWSEGMIYRLATVGQLIFYVCALFGWLLEETRFGKLKPFAIPFYFCMVYVAAMFATLNVLRGHRIELWDPQREEGNASSTTGKITT